MSSKTVHRWYLIHRWTSLSCTLFLLFLCVTGLPLIFHDEIAGMSHASVMEHGAGDATVDVEPLVVRALSKHPDDVVQFVFFDQEHPIISVATAPRLDTPFAQAHIQLFNRYTGAGITPPKPLQVLHWLETAHKDMFLGLPGMLFLGAMGVVFLFALVSGAVLYYPFMNKLSFAVVRKQRSNRVKWLDLHNMLGIVTGAWLFVVGITGVFNTLDTPIANMWQQTSLRALTAAYQDQPVVTQRSSLDAAIAIAMQHSPGMTPYSIAFPGNPFSSPRHYGVYLIGNSDLTQYLLRPVLIDAKTGEFTAASEMPLMVKALFLSKPLHFGNYGGLPLKLIWAALDIVAILVLGSGIYLWLSRRKKLFNRSGRMKEKAS